MVVGDTAKSPRTQADKLRQVFNTKYNATELVGKGIYDQRDVDNISSNDLYVSQFIRETETIQDAADRLHETMKWRKECKIRDITEEYFPREAWDAGAIFFHNTDKDGRRIIWFKVKLHKKDPSKLMGLKQFICFQFESTYNESPEEQIVVLFDMSEAGLSNLDMELIKFVITCFKIYYPKLLGYMLIYEMPWLFNAAWKVIKTWLSPESVKKIKFVTKTDVQEYIDKDQLPEHMGGTDQYKYTYVPPGERDDFEDDMEVEKSSAGKKRVTFADQSSTVYKSFNGDSQRDDFNNSAIHSHKPSVKSPAQRKDPSDENAFVGRLLTICPADELVFTLDDQGKDSYNVISLKNTLPYNIAFKVKTTSPEKYKVRPSTGLVKPGSTAEVYVYLHQSYYTSSVEKDKFLIMAMEMTGDAPDNLTELWRNVQRENIMEHRLRCARGSKPSTPESPEPSTEISTSTESVTALSKKIDALTESNRRLQLTVYVMLILQVLVFMILLFSPFFTGPSSTPVNSSAGNFCSGGFF